ncbi:MAG: PfkB family carbohydrate kinase [Gammaproteobacteria bacterium]
MRIVVLGSFVQACCWKVVRLPKAGETFTASAFSIEPGGKGLNVAVGTRRLGAEVDVLLGIGRDEAGEDVLRLLEKEGINTAYVWRLAPQSGYGAGLIGADGQNAIAVYPGPNVMLSEDHVRQAETALASADLVYGQFETSVAAVAAAFRRACCYGARTVLNPSPWQNVPKQLLDDTDVLLLNEIEARQLLALDVPAPGSLQGWVNVIKPRLDLLWPQWPGSLLVITLGHLGSLAFERHGQVHCAAAFEITAVDCVGAGDAFASGLCIELCKRRPPAEALRYANACGALMASRRGVLNALAEQTALQAFFNSVT